MNRILQLSLLFAITVNGMAQTIYEVSTEVQKKKVLLEEFTGVNCGWCPEGHKIAQQMLTGMAGEAFAVNVHAGYYSTPGAGQPDFRTVEGTELALFLNTQDAGYPCGTLNRLCYDGTNYLSGRSSWLSLADWLHGNDALVNLSLKSTYNGATGKLSINVEGYYTGEVPTDSTQRLNVLWTQDEIYAYQNGGNAGDEYEHNHMLRGYISPMWGDAIEGATKDHYFSKSYEITLPDSINGYAVKPEDVNVIAFVAEGRTNIENVAGGKPTYINYSEVEAAQLKKPNFSIGTRYGFNFFEAELKNLSAKKISTATFDVSIDGQTEEKTIECDIDQFASAKVSIPATMHYASKGKTKYSITLKQLNGISIEPTSISGGFQQPVSTSESVNVKIVTDEKASQNTFLLREADGTVVREFGPYTDGSSHEIEETISGLEDGHTYCFEVYDSYGDGMLEGTKGSLIIHSGTGKLIDQFYTVSGYGVRSFFTVDKALGVEVVSADATAPSRIYDFGGLHTWKTSQNGIYIVKRGNSVTKRIHKSNQ